MKLIVACFPVTKPEAQLCNQTFHSQCLGNQVEPVYSGFQIIIAVSSGAVEFAPWSVTKQAMVMSIHYIQLQVQASTFRHML